MAFKNRIRLPIYLTRPQFPTEKTVFIKADGSRKTQSVVLSKVYEGVTDKFPEWVHERLKIALEHDHVIIEGERYFGELIADGYDVDWEIFMDYPYAPAGFKAIVNPYGMVNSNCQSCEEASQLMLVDDTLPDILDQSTTYELNVFENDSIICRPFTAEITYINPVFVESATIDETTGLVTIVTKALFFQRNEVVLATYRVTCNNGAYDEADIIASLQGDLAACLEPTSLSVVSKDSDSIVMSWVAPGTPPAEGYEWKITQAALPALIEDSGTTAGTSASMPSDPLLAALTPATTYTFSVRSKCGTDDYSQWVNYTVTTDTLADDSCGRYRITFFDEFRNKNYKDIQYVHCNGSVTTIRLYSYKSQFICAAQNALGHPVSIIGADQVQYANKCPNTLL